MFSCCPCCCCPWFYYCIKQKIFADRQNYKSSQREKPYRQKEFNVEELAQYDGSSGKPAYVAVNGIVYDVSFNGAWGGGTHFGLYGGRDLTSQFQGCHASDMILNKLPKVGVLK